ncbi:uncharacterized protein IWZ02DRAFT_489485 [Phyllosticta citriasiana]|uniref:Uncharacterized protein n=1 Tax=Phyllosticta citriasiana TaxID=595635 RepID=A0ABR1KP10_9PEZI
MAKRKRDNSIETIDTNKIIWILNTKLGHSENWDASENGMARDNWNPLKWLQSTTAELSLASLQDGYRDLICAVVSFFTFNRPKQAVAAHKLLLQLSADAQSPVDFKPDVERYVGHVSNATRMCHEIAMDQYSMRLGFLSYFHATEEIRTKLCTAYSQIKDKITERDG